MSVLAPSTDGQLRRRSTDQPAPTQQRPRPIGPNKPGPRRWTPFLISAAAAAAAILLLELLVGLKLLGSGVASFVDYGEQSLAALAAAVSCGLLARRSTGRLRIAWALIAASALITFTVGAGTFLVYGLLTGGPVPFPSPADALYLIGMVVMAAGVMMFPSAPSRRSSRGRAAIDGSVIAISLLYIAWALGLGGLYAQSHASIIGKVISLAYPVLDIVIVTVLILTIRRALQTKIGRLNLLLAGLVVKSLADGWLAVLSVQVGQGTDDYLSVAAWILGFILIALAAQWPVHPSVRSAEDGPTSLWSMLMPWTGLVCVILTSLGMVLLGRPMDPFLVYPGVALVLLMMASQVLAYRDSLTFLNKSRRAEAALQERTQLLNQVIAHAPLGVARVGADSRFIDANPRLGSLLHAPMKIVIGARVAEFVMRENSPERIKQYQSLIEGAVDTVEEDGQVRRADGSIAWLHWTTTAVRKSDGTFEYFLSMAEDITSRHEADETAMANLAGLERLNKLKSEFVSMVSHEFRTALVGIQGFSELIRDEQLEVPEIKELAGDINNDALRLNRMIGEMLDLDRMEAGKIRLDIKPINLNKLLRDAVERAQLGTDKHTLVTDLDLVLPVVSGDSDRLIQVISNLLVNAIKYSPHGGEIKVSSRVEAGSVRVTVEDHGLGIPPEFIKRLFGRYERFESNHAGKVVGTGLGLAITLQIVELHGGKIWVDSALGRGSSFHFTIPMAAAAVNGEPMPPVANYSTG